MDEEAATYSAEASARKTARRRGLRSDQGRRHSFDSSHLALASGTGFSLNGSPGNDFCPKLTFLDQLLRNKYPETFEFREKKKNVFFYFEKKVAARK